MGDEVTDHLLRTGNDSRSTPRRISRRCGLRLRAIVPLQTATGQPTRAADPRLAPELPGVTDQASIHDWEIPFELVETIRPQDETYWDQHAATPKAFISFAAAQRAWKTRWGTDQPGSFTGTPSWDGHPLLSKSYWPNSIRPT